MDPIDLYAPDLHDRLAEVAAAGSAVTARTIGGRAHTGRIARIDSDPGRSVSFTMDTAGGPVPLAAVECLSLHIGTPPAD